jgi:hypothetical protein
MQTPFKRPQAKSKHPGLAHIPPPGWERPGIEARMYGRITGGYSMTTLVTMEDGTGKALEEHLSGDHRKGTTGYTDEFLDKMHARLHDHKHEPEHTHANLIPAQRHPEEA